jgi:hypothetical protein
MLQIRLADWIASIIFLRPPGSREIGTHLMMSLQEDTGIEQVMWKHYISGTVTYALI